MSPHRQQLLISWLSDLSIKIHASSFKKVWSGAAQSLRPSASCKTRSDPWRSQFCEHGQLRIHFAKLSHIARPLHWVAHRFHPRPHPHYYLSALNFGSIANQRSTFESHHRHRLIPCPKTFLLRMPKLCYCHCQAFFDLNFLLVSSTDHFLRL